MLTFFFLLFLDGLQIQFSVVQQSQASCYLYIKMSAIIFIHWSWIFLKHGEKRALGIDRHPKYWGSQSDWCFSKRPLNLLRLCRKHFLLSILQTLLQVSTPALTRQCVHMMKSKPSQRSTVLTQNTKIPHTYFTRLDMFWGLCLHDLKWEFYSVCLCWAQFIVGMRYWFRPHFS